MDEKSRLIRQQIALRKVAASLRDIDVPGWETPEAATAWVNTTRVLDDERLDALLRDHL